MYPGFSFMVRELRYRTVTTKMKYGWWERMGMRSEKKRR
jgi:hypothetical protein